LVETNAELNLAKLFEAVQKNAQSKLTNKGGK
jgi:hypothetical protein